ncbi:RNA polymerase sigma factor [Agaribacter flavus]|uniref:RNA polymerase sigma factor n=1 Tax=Agaribacter flavus TaxID=1902781 RepID=A0ABV7FRM8_9ALTE
MTERGQDPTGTSSRDLVAQIQAGNRAAEETLVLKYWKSLYFIINRKANAPDLSADLVQDTLLTVIEKARKGEIENADALASFIRQTGMNLLLAHYRKEARRKTDTQEDNELPFPDLSPNVEHKLQHDELVCLVNSVIDEMPTPRDKDILFRYYLHGQSKDLVCEELSLSSMHFDRVLFRARTRLKEIIAKKLKVEPRALKLAKLLAIISFCIGLAQYIDFTDAVDGVASKFVNQVGVFADTRHYVSHQSANKGFIYRTSPVVFKRDY